MLKFSKVGLLLAILALSGLMASTASAANWHTNGPAAFHSTNAGASRLVVHTASSSLIVRCSSSTGSGTINGPTNAALPWLSAATVTPAFGSPCFVNDVAGYSVVCSPAELRANSYAGGDTFATAAGGVTTGSIYNIDCTIKFGATSCSTVTGSVPGHYTNPNTLAAGSGALKVTTAGQSLTVEKIGAGCAAIPHGTGTFGLPGTGSTVTDITYTIDGPNAPYIYRGT
jgi:hypothetical protein